MNLAEKLGVSNKTIATQQTDILGTHTSQLALLRHLVRHTAANHNAHDCKTATCEHSYRTRHREILTSIEFKVEELCSPSGDTDIHKYLATECQCQQPNCLLRKDTYEKLLKRNTLGLCANLGSVLHAEYAVERNKESEESESDKCILPTESL